MSNMNNKGVVRQQKTPHRWKPGESGNPNGRPRKPEIDLLRSALEKAKDKYGVEFIEHFVMKAYKDKAMAIALMKKLIPDKSNIEYAPSENLYDKYKDFTHEQYKEKLLELLGMSHLYHKQ